jgi:hypothetical protein
VPRKGRAWQKRYKPAKRWYAPGTITMSNAWNVTSPKKIAIAIGASISLPASYAHRNRHPSQTGRHGGHQNNRLSLNIGRATGCGAMSPGIRV